MLAGEKLSSDLGIALMNEVFVYKASALTSVSRNVLLSDHMSSASNPVDRILAEVAVDVWVDFPTDR